MATQEEIKNKWEQAQRTSLWTRTLGSADAHVAPLRDSFLDARKNAEFLLNKIRNDFKNLTVHDITHVDSLWNVADTIIGKDYPINPLEGYVLGIAFLIHDAALSYDAVGGKEKLRDTIEWKDACADGPGEKDEEEFKKDCDFAAIRALHARYAEDILNKKFERDNTTTFYIIGNDEYRTQFGDMIGKIAASHHWSIDDVESNLEIQINPVAGFPSDWEINEQKLACILRCADAGHIDNGRAPFGIYNSLIVNGVSRDHWESQIRLGQVRENRKNPEQLLITSTRPFDKDNFAAWNVAYDAVRLFDEELKKSNELLKPSGLSFPHIGVAGAEFKEALSEYIKTHGWQPCSLGVHTGNVKALIENLGGSKLYGEENLLLVTLRELIQNARDAIYARGTLDEQFKEGKITIRLEEGNGKRCVEVVDNGIGMSLDCIKHHFLDFGSSYWKSSLSKFENPGLRSKGFRSIGKFGIGFYSVFMVAKSVEVVTRRYNKGGEAMKVEFPEGLTLSPIMSKDQLSTSVSTIVRFELKDDVLLSFHVNHYDDFISFQKALQIVVAGLDTDVYYEMDDSPQLIHTNVKSNAFNKVEWLKGVLIQTMADDEVERLSKRLNMLPDETGDIVACLAIPDKNYEKIIIPSIETVCGLATSIDSIGVNKGFVGFISCSEADISRNVFFSSKKMSIILQDWLNEKYNDEYDSIVKSSILSNNYFHAMSYFKINIQKIEEENMKILYATYRSRNIEVGTIKGLKSIHMMLFSGISDFAGRYRVHDVAFYNRNKITKAIDLEILNDVLDAINKMPNNSFENIVLKYLLLMKAHPFTDGNERAGRIWVNLMLDQINGTMIDWRKVDNYTFNNIIYSKLQNIEYDSEVLKEECLKDACDCLVKFLIPTKTYIAEITML